MTVYRVTTISCKKDEYYEFDSRIKFVAKIRECIKKGYIPWTVNTNTNTIILTTRAWVLKDGGSLDEYIVTPGYQSFHAEIPSMGWWYYRVYCYLRVESFGEDKH